MSEFVIYVLLLSIWNVILFYGKEYGISVILFMLPMLLYFYLLFKKNKLIKNKKGLLFMIPILLLSLTYLIYNNSTFGELNFLAIILLFILMYIFTIKPSYNISNLFNNLVLIFVKPWDYIGRFYRVATANIKIKMSDKTKKVLKSILIVLPVVIVVLILLSKADMIFENIFSGVFGKIKHWLSYDLFDNLIGKLIVTIILFFLIGCTSLYLIFSFNKEEEKNSNKKFNDVFTIKLLITILDVIYVLFDFIQIKSLMLHNVSSGINFAEYARQGFFELMGVSLINLIIILISKRFNIKDKKDSKYIKIMNVLMIFLTLIIIVSSFMRMNLYEAAYGYTVLRLLVYITLITESILLIPTVMYIFNSKFNIVKSYMIIITVVYCLINFINIDYLIAYRNVNKYYHDNKIDIEYLENYNTDNIPMLIDLYKNTKDENIRNDLKDYFNDLKTISRTDSCFEYNISKNNGLRMLKELDY